MRFTPWCLLSVALILGPGLTTTAGEPASQIHWYTDLVKAYDEARDRHKPLVVYFRVDRCRRCSRLDQDVLSARPINDLAERAVFVRVNPETDRNGGAMSSALKIAGYPTVVSFEAKPAAIEEIGRVVGYLPVDEFYRQLTAYLELPHRRP